MRKLIAAIMVAGATLVAGPALSADIPLYPPVIDIPKLPPVDHGLGGSFYLRGSAAGNLLWSPGAWAYECPPGCTPGPLVEREFPITAWGYGYSVGGGVGFETGTGLRFDATVDHVGNEGLSIVKGPEFVDRDGTYSMRMRSTLALANVYYDFSFDNWGGSYGKYGYSAAGGLFGYVGAGAGVAFNHSVEIDTPEGVTVPSGSNTSFAAAGMVGVGYDFGAVVADLGYRGVYINQISTNASYPDAVWSDHNWLHEVRGTVRYRFN